MFSPWTAYSIRYRVLNPYFSLRATLPLAVQGSAYDNCSNYQLLADVATMDCPQAQTGNGATTNAAAIADWQGDTGYKPAFTGEFKLGTEFVVAEDPSGHQKFAFDLNAVTTWFSPARDYSMVSDALGKLTYEDEHITSIGTFGIYGRVARWLHFRVSGSLGFDTPHFLTDESIGKDLNGDGVVTISRGRPQQERRAEPALRFPPRSSRPPAARRADLDLGRLRDDVAEFLIRSSALTRERQRQRRRTTLTASAS